MQRIALDQRTLTERLVSSMAGLDSTKEENMLFFVCGKAVDSLPVNQYSFILLDAVT